MHAQSRPFSRFAALFFLTVTGVLFAHEPAAGPQSCTVSATGHEHRVWGTVTDTSGAALTNAAVTATCGAIQRNARTDAAGNYSVSLPAGTFTVEAQADGFAVLSRSVRVEKNDVRLDLSLELSNVNTTVSVNESAGYLSEDSTAATKTASSPLETPQSITVVTRKLLNEQGAVKLDDALRNVAGVMPGGYYDGWDYYRIRGFDAAFNTFLDGMRGGNGTSDETYGLQSVEVLKGPSSALYGQSVLGGLVNLTSKRPTPDAFAHVSFTGGSFGFWNPAVDVGGSLNRSRSVYGRLVALYRSQDSFTDYAFLHRTYLAPSLTWRMGSATTLTLLGRYQREYGRAGYPLPATGTILPNINGQIPVSRYIGELGGENNTVREENRQLGYQFVHQFNEAVLFRSNARVALYHQEWNHLLYPSSLSEDERVLLRYPLDYHQAWRNYSTDNNLEASFETGPVRHTFLAGYDFFRNPQKFSGESIDFNDMTQYMPLDLFRPVYGAARYPAALIPSYGGRTLVQYQGLYLQDQARITSRLTATFGGRFNFARNQTQPDPANNTYAFTPRVGLTYQLRTGLAAYASFSRSFLPQTGQIFSATNSAGTFAAPERGQQWEAGLKSSLRGGRLSSTLALFDLQRNNVLTPDVAHPNFFVLTGKQRSQGVEFETSALLRPGWNVTAAYAYIFARVTDDTQITPGTPTRNAPRNSGSAWTRYEFQRGWWRGIALGVGGRYYSRQAGDLTNSFQLPSYGLFEASISYRRGPFHIQLNGYNLADVRYATGSYSDVYVKPGAPRSARVTVDWDF